MQKRINLKLNTLFSNKGFTLIEVMVVLVIMGILAAIVGPNAGAYVDRMNVKNYIAAARLAEDTTMALAGMQYAQVGNPIMGDPHKQKSSGGKTYNESWGVPYYLDEEEFGKQYVYLDSYYYPYNLEGVKKNYVRMAPANLAAKNEFRKSAGISEYESRTGEPIPQPSPWGSHGSYEGVEQQACFSVFLKYNPDDINGTTSSFFTGLKDNKYFKYDFYGSWYNRDFDGKYITVLHNFKLSQGGNEEVISTKTDDKAFENSLLAAEGWYVYEYKDYDSSITHSGGTYYLLDSQMQV